MTSNSAAALRDIFAAGLPLFRQHVECTRNLNVLFMDAWQRGILGEFWTEYKHTWPEMRLHYFVRARGIGDIKIGKTKDIVGRMRQMFTFCSRGADLLACYPGNMAHETELHREFEQSRLCGEWFRASSELLDYLEMIGADLSVSTDMPARKWSMR